MAEPLERQVKRLHKKLEKISTVEADRASSSALNKTTSKGRTLLARSVARDLNVPVGQVRKRIKIRRSTARTKRANFAIFVRPIPLISLLSKNRAIKAMGRGTNRRGVTYRGRHYPGAFINPVHGGTTIQVLKREGSGRYPLEVIKIKLQGTAQYHWRRIIPRLMRDEFPALLKRDIKFRLKKYGKRT